ncbi:hypothetical protein HRbin37_00119 [bacterium HR37]|nr:hypothetical protein HRbin37_00119 [bacterium HR37]
MSKLIEPRPVKLFIGIIYSKDAPIKDCINILKEKFGEIDFISEVMPFNFTSYYEKEMGKDLLRQIISFKRLIKREELIEIKITTTEIEEKFSIEGKRMFNLDPGYIAPEHLILATGKGYYHRPYLGKGVYADLTLIYRQRDFQPLEWTYPDYRGEELRGVFREIRKKYMSDLREELGK